jgi:hypothetical protein
MPGSSMAKVPGRTDYMSIDEFKRRALAAIERGDKPRPRKTLIIDVPYSADFNVFAASVAHAIRGEVVYRSDGGVFARGFVRASGDLEKLHDFFRHPDNRPGSTVRIVGFLWRRQDPAASMRWVMSIRFELPTIDFSKEEVEQINARQDVVTGLEKHLVEQMLDQATTATESSAWNPPNRAGVDRVRRIRDWVHTATTAGYPALLNLWYYDRRAVFQYVQLKVSLDGRWTPKQKEMTTKTGGRLPFDGDNGFPEHLPWRHYLFREMLAKCRGKDTDACYAIVGRMMSDAEDEILRTFSEVQHEVNRAASYQNAMQHSAVPINPKTTLTGADSGALGVDANAFLKHLMSLANDPNSLYHPFTRYSQASPGLWGTF